MFVWERHVLAEWQCLEVHHSIWCAGVAEPKGLWIVCLFVCVKAVFFTAHCFTKGVAISVISASGLIVLNVSHSHRCSVDRRGPVWRTSLMRFQAVRPICDLSFIPCWVRFSSIKCWPVLRPVNASPTDISCLISAASPGSSGCRRAGPGRAQRRRERETEKEMWKDWLARQQFIKMTWRRGGENLKNYIRGQCRLPTSRKPCFHFLKYWVSDRMEDEKSIYSRHKQT